MKVETKVGQTVYQVQINIRSKESRSITDVVAPHGIHVKMLSIVHQTDSKVALDDDCITVLDKDSSWILSLNRPKIDVRADDDLLPNGVFISMYTTFEPKTAINFLKDAFKKHPTNINIDDFVKNTTITYK